MEFRFSEWSKMQFGSEYNATSMQLILWLHSNSDCTQRSDCCHAVALSTLAALNLAGSIHTLALHFWLQSLKFSSFIDGGIRNFDRFSKLIPSMVRGKFLRSSEIMVSTPNNKSSKSFHLYADSLCPNHRYSVACLLQVANLNKSDAHYIERHRVA